MATAGNGGSLGTGDSSAAGIAGLTAALLAVAEVGGRSARDAYFLSELSADGLPMAIGVSAVLALLCTLGLSQWLRVHSPDRVAPLALLGAAASFVGLALIASVDRILASAAFYLLMTGVVPVVFTAFWSVINERFDPYTAKTVVAKLAAAGALGGVVGGVTADRTVALLGMPSVLIGLAVLMSIAAWTTRSVAAGGVSRVGRSRPNPAPSNRTTRCHRA